MRRFGSAVLLPSRAWLDAPEAPAPIGSPCARCDEPIAEGERGWLIPHYDGAALSERPYHYACGIRGIIGSVGHIQRRCSCYGGTDEDPPGMTERQAAEAALALFEEMQR